MGIVWTVALLVFSADSLIKHYLRAHFAFQSIPLIPGIFHITVIFNKGAAFGILKGHTQFLLYAGVIFILLLLYFLRQRKCHTLWENVFFGLVLGGALSNMCDRIFHGYVIDYIDIRIWPVFNLSDSCISVGGAGLIFKSFRKDGNAVYRNADGGGDAA